MIGNIFYWNIRGLGTSKRRLKSLIIKKDINICVIAEPFVGHNRMAATGSFLNLNYFCSNESMGGKLWIFGKELNEFQMVFCTSQTISGWLSWANQKLLITFVYAKCSYTEKRGLWEKLEN